MAKTSTKRKQTRKRRSFFEPESKVLAKWLADQNDLGVSLQLIIVDAIRNYGEGDAIQSFLKARETLPGEVPVTKSTVATEAVKEVPVLAEALPKSAPKVDAKPKTAPKPEPELSVEELPVGPEPKAPVIEKPAANAKTETPEYDPVNIMFQDIGSSMNN